MNCSTEDFGGSDVFTDTGASHPVDVVDSRRRLLHFARAIAELPPACRQVFWLRKVEGLKVMEIASRLGISGSAVEKHVASGLLKCSQYFRSIGIDPVDLVPIAADLDGLRDGMNRFSAGSDFD
jgi:RNA polymerase sigma-70 factor (ECF subfamily)